ncbi:MAG: hypothetical protein AAFQ62_05375 [Pseudomonadota bacterium]
MADEKRSFWIEVTSPGFNYEDPGWDHTGKTYAETWRQIESVLSTIEVEAFETQFEVSFDWSGVAKKVTLAHKAVEQIEVHGANPVDAGFPRHRTRVAISSRSGRPFPTDREHIAVVESILHDVFLISNLSAPGAGDMYWAAIRRKGERSSSRVHTLDLSGGQFDIAFVDTNLEKWPHVRTLPVHQVHAWFSANRAGVTQVPRTPGERVLFALLHIAQLEMSPVIVLWLFFALETLLDTKSGENLRVMQKRIELLLRPNSKQKKYLKSQMRELYDRRSSLVHGGFDLLHPMAEEILDPGVWPTHKKVLDPIEFGFRVLLACLQEVIARGYIWPSFSEHLDGDRFTE